MTSPTKVQQSVSLKQLRTEWPKIEDELSKGAVIAIERHRRPVAIMLPLPQGCPADELAPELREMAGRLAALAAAAMRQPPF